MRRVQSCLAVIGILAAAVLLDDYHVYLLSQIFLAAIVSLGLVLMSGVAGLTSFGQAALFGVAAYTTAVGTVAFGLSPWVTLWIALAIVGLVAFLAGAVTVGLSGHYLPLCTLAWALGIFNVFGNVDGLGRFEGIGNIPPLMVFGTIIQGPGTLVLTGGAFIVLMLLCWNLLDSRIGRALRILALGRQMPECMGINTFRLRLTIFVLSALFAGGAGWLYAHIQRFVNPTPFGLDAGVEYMFMALLGGSTSLWGALFGPVLLISAREWLKQVLPGLLGHAGDFDIIIFSAALILLIQRAPGGLTGWWAAVRPAPPPGRRFETSSQSVAALPRRAFPPRGEPLLVAHGLGKRFGGLVANEALSFSLNAGEILAVIGPNGAGKSTLFNLLSGVDRPDTGRIFLAGQRIDMCNARDIMALGMSRTFQHVKLLSEMSVVDNIAVGAYRRGRAGWLRAMLRLNRAEESAILFEAAQQAKACGLDDQLHRPAGSLPLGLQRVVELGRALAGDPAALLLDEPAAGLRSKEKELLSTLLSGLRAKGLAILIVEHDMDFVMSLADRVIVINFGRILAEGSPKEIQINPDVLEAYLGTST